MNSNHHLLSTPVPIPTGIACNRHNDSFSSAVELSASIGDGTPPRSSSTARGQPDGSIRATLVTNRRGRQRHIFGPFEFDDFVQQVSARIGAHRLRLLITRTPPVARAAAVEPPPRTLHLPQPEAAALRPVRRAALPSHRAYRS